MKKLTKTEEEIMQIIWHLEKCFVKDIIDKIADPKPPYQTISSVVRILEKKGFVAYKAYGKTHEYYPIIEKSKYRKNIFNSLFTNYFDGSFKQLASFFVHEKNIDTNELKDLLKELENDDKT